MPCRIVPLPFPSGKSLLLHHLLAGAASVSLLVPAAPGESDPAAPQAGEFFRAETPLPLPSADRPATSLTAVPARPASRVLDDARIFSPEESAEMAALLREGAERDQLDVYVAATSFVVGETVEDYAQRLANAWCESPRGFVLLYLRSEKTVTMSTPGGEETFLGPRALRRCYENAITAAKVVDSAPERLRVTATELLGGLHLALAEQTRMERVLNPDVLRVLAFFLGALVVLGGAGSAFAALIRRIERKQDTRYHFPPTPVPTRFGAPFGGGVCAEIQFPLRAA